MKLLFDRTPAFKCFIENPDDFADVYVGTSGYGVAWNDHMDLSWDELWKNGETIKTP